MDGLKSKDETKSADRAELEKLYQTPCVAIPQGKYKMDVEGAKRFLLEGGANHGERELLMALALEMREHQLRMARYAMHKVRTKIYALEVMAGSMTEEQAAEMYNEAMRNFDALLNSAADGKLLEAEEEAMDKGFQISEVLQKDIS